jgi:hypothetical protein
MNVIGNQIGNYYNRLEYYNKNVKFIIKISDFEEELWEYIANDIKTNCQLSSNKEAAIELSITEDGYVILLIINDKNIINSNIITIYILLILSDNESVLSIITKLPDCVFIRIFGVTGNGFTLDSPRRYYDDEEDSFNVDEYKWGYRFDQLANIPNYSKLNTYEPINI